MEIKDAVIIGYEKLGAGQIPYVSYTIEVNFNNSTRSTLIHRRFNDFKWLYNSLTEELPAYTIPPLPKINQITVYQDRFDPEFIELRKKYLTLFLRRIIETEPIRESLSFEAFITCFDPPHIAAKIPLGDDNTLLGLASTFTSKLHHRSLELPAEIASAKILAKKKFEILKKLSSLQYSLDESSDYASRCALQASNDCGAIALLTLNLAIPKLDIPRDKRPTFSYDLSDLSEILASELRSFRYVKDVARTCADLSSYKAKIAKERQNIILMKPNSGILSILKLPFTDPAYNMENQSFQKGRILEAEARLAELNDALAKGMIEFNDAKSIVISQDKTTSDYITSTLKSSFISYCTHKIAFHELLYNYWKDVAELLDFAA